MTLIDLVLPFADVGLTDRPVVGGKGASLGELIRAGLSVPPGFVVTTAAFERALAALDPDGEIRREIRRLDGGDGGAIAQAAAAIRARIEGFPLPEEVRAAIARGYGGLGPGSPGTAGAAAGTAVAVRSSATSEDSAEASFAGLQDTFLWVRGEDAVIEHVRRCWSSLYSVESVTYRLRLGLPEESVAMGVVIQAMVDARASGVMFTRSPTTGDRSVVALEGSWGLGSAVVSGEVTPDKFVVSKVTGDIIQRNVALKTRQHRAHPSGSGVIESEVPDDLQDQPCVSDAEIRALVDLARSIEAHYGGPQDIEWAVTPAGPAEGGLYVLQSRPETVWSSRENAPVASPKLRAFDHVLARFGSGPAAGGGSGGGSAVTAGGGRLAT